MGEKSTHIAIFLLLRVQTILAKSVETNMKLLSKLCKNNTVICLNAPPPLFNVVRLQGHEMWQQLSML